MDDDGAVMAANPLGVPPSGWRPPFNRGPVRWESPRGTRCWKERRRAYQVGRRPSSLLFNPFARTDLDHHCHDGLLDGANGTSTVVAEEQHVMFVLGDAIFVQHSVVDRANASESITFQLLDAKQAWLFLEIQEHSTPQPGHVEGDGDDAIMPSSTASNLAPSERCVFKHGDALGAGVVLRVFAQLEHVDPDALLDQLPGEYAYKDLLRRCVAASAESLADVRTPMMAALARRHQGENALTSSSGSGRAGHHRDQDSGSRHGSRGGGRHDDGCCTM